MIVSNEYPEASLKASCTGQNLKVLHMPLETYLLLQFSYHKTTQDNTHANSSTNSNYNQCPSEMHMKSFHYRDSFFQSLRSQQNHCLLTWPPLQLLFFSLLYDKLCCSVSYTSIVLTTRHSTNLQYWDPLRIYLASPSEIPLLSLNWPKRRTPYLFADSLEHCHDIKTVLVKSNMEKLFTSYTALCQLQNGVNRSRYPLPLSCSVQAYFSPHSWLPYTWSLKENIWFSLYS